MIVALRVVRGQSRPYEFVFFITYLAQLYGPLNMLGYLYRTINQSLVDTERLLKLLSESREVNDKPNAPDLVVEAGSIEFGERLVLDPETWVGCTDLETLYLPQRTSTSLTTPAQRPSTASPSRSPKALLLPLWANLARGSPRSCVSCTASTTSRRARDES